jgi:hypothetical protein
VHGLVPGKLVTACVLQVLYVLTRHGCRDVCIFASRTQGGTRGRRSRKPNDVQLHAPVFKPTTKVRAVNPKSKLLMLCTNSEIRCCQCSRPIKLWEECAPFMLEALCSGCTAEHNSKSHPDNWYKLSIARNFERYPYV